MILYLFYVVQQILVLLLFGVKNLPKIARAIGEALKEFKKSVQDTEEEK